MRILNEGHRAARKSHWCDAWHWISENDIPPDYRCGGINKGDEYYYQVNTYDGV